MLQDQPWDCPDYFRGSFVHKYEYEFLKNCFGPSYFETALESAKNDIHSVRKIRDPKN